MVLLIFGVMLTSPQLQPLLRVQPAEKILALAISLGLLALLTGTALISQRSWPEKESPSGGKHLTTGEKWQGEAVNRDISTQVLAAMLVGIPTDRGQPAIGAQREGWVPYVFVFEIISVHLLVVLIAAAYLARPRRPPLPDFLLADEPSAEHAAGSARIPDQLDSEPQSEDVSPTG
jgi:NADH-quinone oxidoreductase subunit J